MTVRGARAVFIPDGPLVGRVICRATGKPVAEVWQSAINDGIAFLRVRRREWAPGRDPMGSPFDLVESHVPLDGVELHYQRASNAGMNVASCRPCGDHRVDLDELTRAVQRESAEGARKLRFLV